MPSTNEQALDEIIDLIIVNDRIREVLNSAASKAFSALLAKPDNWYNLDLSAQMKTKKVLASLGNSKISYLVDAVFSSPDVNSADFVMVGDELRAYLLCVVFYAMTEVH